MDEKKQEPEKFYCESEDLFLILECLKNASGEVSSAKLAIFVIILMVSDLSVVKRLLQQSFS